jgi:hypothetical protein
LGLLLAAVRKLSEWLSTDSLFFEFVLPQDKNAKPLAQESGLLEMLFREQIASGLVAINHLAGDPGKYADERADRSLCHALAISVGGTEVRSTLAETTALAVNSARPRIRVRYDEPIEMPADDAFECWTATLQRLLAAWV